jgi:hypothetical protein
VDLFKLISDQLKPGDKMSLRYLPKVSYTSKEQFDSRLFPTVVSRRLLCHGLCGEMQAPADCVFGLFLVHLRTSREVSPQLQQFDMHQRGTHLGHRPV